jgi:hypothetical protein
MTLYINVDIVTQMLSGPTLWLTFHFHAMLCYAMLCYAMLVRWFGAYTFGQRLGLCSTSQSTEWNWKEAWCWGWEGCKIQVLHHGVVWALCRVIIPSPIWLLVVTVSVLKSYEIQLSFQMMQCAHSSEVVTLQKANWCYKKLFHRDSHLDQLC